MSTNKGIRYVDKGGDLRHQDKLKTPEKRSSDFDYMRYMNIGFYLMIPLLAGVFGGLFIDNKLHTRPAFVISGIILGAIASLYNLIKLTNEK
ncbi:AtpZ/AtpI family protein [Candidatus Roizmanbacteria bacterium]|nr:AtpZ/AtpI family protein [Candidatus Roizmanbacteria bacterium]